MVMSWAVLLVTAGLSCPTGMTAVDEACVVRGKGPLVVYFHGMLPGPTDFRHVRELSLLAAEAKRQGATLVALRGQQGLCGWSKEVSTHWCWPNDLSQRALVKPVLDRLGRVLAQLETRSPAVFVGFSNGGYFTAMVASESDAEARGYVVLHAGNVTGEVFSPERSRPVLVLGASRDAIQLPGAKRLYAMLLEAKWPAQLEVRDGVHEVTAADARAVFEFAAKN